MRAQESIMSAHCTVLLEPNTHHTDYYLFFSEGNVLRIKSKLNASPSKTTIVIATYGKRLCYFHPRFLLLNPSRENRIL